MAAELDATTSSRDAALKDNAELRVDLGRASRSLQALTHERREHLLKIFNLERGLRVRELRAVVERRDAEIVKLKADIVKLNAWNLSPMPHDLHVRQRHRRRRRSGEERVVTYVRESNQLHDRKQAWRARGEHWFGIDGYVWMVAYELSSLMGKHGSKPMDELMMMSKPRAYMQQLIDKGIKRAEQSDEIAEKAKLTMLLTVVGRNKWEKQRRALKVRL